jgi:hypothetical protein
MHRNFKNKGPDERFETVNKDTTRDTDAEERNRQKPDEIRAKGEVTARQHECDESESEE